MTKGRARARSSRNDGHGESRFGPITPFARYIRKRRRELDITQKEVGRRMRPDDPVHPTYISQLENGRLPDMGIEGLTRLAKALEVGVHTLLEEGQLADLPGYQDDQGQIDAKIMPVVEVVRLLSSRSVAQLLSIALTLRQRDLEDQAQEALRAAAAQDATRRATNGHLS